MEEDTLNIWLTNTASTISNQRVLFLNVNDSQEIINDLNKQYQVTPIKIKDLEEYKKVINGMNPIIISDGFYNKTIENMKSLISNEVIYIEDINSINKLINFIKDKSLDNKNEIKYEMLEKVAFESFFKDNNVDIKRFVLDRLDLLNKMNCNFENIDIDFLITCLKNYEKKILFASFAQLLYRLANLDFTSTTKRVGGNIRKILGVKSSTSSRSSLVDLKINQFSKGFRVYDLNKNTLVTDEKIRIAEELVKLDSKDLDITKISKITELPLKKVEKMYREAFLG